MSITELIKVLEKTLATHGDILVKAPDGNGDLSNAETFIFHSGQVSQNGDLVQFLVIEGEEREDEEDEEGE